jgi:photoactive yellow protein
MWSDAEQSCRLTKSNIEEAELLGMLTAMGANELDELPFGVINFDEHFIVRRYNRYEQVHAGLSLEEVTGKHVFTELAQCMNNFMAAEMFEAAKASGQALDATIDYVLTWRMKPTPVKLRMLSAPSMPGGYLLLKRLH